MIPEIYRSVCVVCGKEYASALRKSRTYTCSDPCHEVFVDNLVKKFGEYKKVMDSETLKIHRVPTRDIIEKGLKYSDLTKYPLWEEDQS